MSDTVDRINHNAEVSNEDELEDEIDLDDDEIDDMLDDDEIAGNLPQEVTESYGTGVHEQPGVARQGGRTAALHPERFNEASARLTGGDVDANYEQANAVGDEAVGGTVATPDQDVVDELGAAVGLEMDDRSFLRTNDILEDRDNRRWELEPKSSEDYDDRRED